MWRRIVCVLVVWVNLITSVAWAGGTGSDDGALEVKLEEYARGHAEHLNALLDNQTYLDYWVNTYAGCDQDEWEVVSSTDYSTPRKINIILRPMEELELIQSIDIPSKDREYLTEHAFQELCIMPLFLLRQHADLPMRLTKEALIIRDAIELENLDGVAYVVQVYEDYNGHEAPLLITSFVPSDGAILAQTEIVYGNNGDVETLHSLFLGLIETYPGSLEISDIIVRDYHGVEAE